MSEQISISVSYLFSIWSMMFGLSNDIFCAVVGGAIMASATSINLLMCGKITGKNEGTLSCKHNYTSTLSFKPN